jgi:D-3-phosphoglycerate dehydrogenase
VEAQDKAGTDVARAVADALRGELVTTAVNLDLGRDVPDELAAFLPVAERLGGVLVALAQGLPGTLAVRAEGRLADLPVRPLALAAIKGVVARVTDQPVSFVNAPALAEARGMRVVEESAAGIEDYAAVVRLTGTVGDRTLSLAGSVIGRKGAVVVEALDHQIELPISDFMLIVLNEDVPGVIGRVGTYLGEQGINIANMVVGRSPTGDSAMMGLNLDRSMTEPEVEGFRALGGVERAWPVDLS